MDGEDAKKLKAEVDSGDLGITTFGTNAYKCKMNLYLS